MQLEKLGQSFARRTINQGKNITKRGWVSRRVCTRSVSHIQRVRETERAQKNVEVGYELTQLDFKCFKFTFFSLFALMA